MLKVTAQKILQELNAAHADMNTFLPFYTREDTSAHHVIRKSYRIWGMAVHKCAEELLFSKLRMISSTRLTVFIYYNKILHYSLSQLLCDVCHKLGILDFSL